MKGYMVVAAMVPAWLAVQALAGGDEGGVVKSACQVTVATSGSATGATPTVTVMPCETASSGAACKVVIRAENARTVPAEGYGHLDTAALKGLIEAKTPMVLVDARTAKFDDGKRLPGALALPADSADEAIQKALPDKGALIVAYCSNLKCPASKILAAKLLKLGYTKVMKYPDGIQGWIEAGNAVTELKK